MKITYRQPTEDDILSVAARMRSEDVREVLATSGSTPLEALQESVELSDFAIAAVWNGEAQVIYGFCTCEEIPHAAIMWLLGTVEVPKNAREFFKESKRLIAGFSQHFTFIYNCVDVRNEFSLRWLRALGFESLRTHPEFGVGKTPFIEMALDRV